MSKDVHDRAIVLFGDMEYGAEQTASARDGIGRLVPPGERFVLVDDAALGGRRRSQRGSLPGARRTPLGAARRLRHRHRGARAHARLGRLLPRLRLAGVLVARPLRRFQAPSLLALPLRAAPGRRRRHRTRGLRTRCPRPRGRTKRMAGPAARARPHPSARPGAGARRRLPAGHRGPGVRRGRAPARRLSGVRRLRLDARGRRQALEGVEAEEPHVLASERRRSGDGSPKPSATR